MRNLEVKRLHIPLALSIGVFHTAFMRSHKLCILTHVSGNFTVMRSTSDWRDEDVKHVFLSVMAIIISTPATIPHIFLLEPFTAETFLIAR